MLGIPTGPLVAVTSGPSAVHRSWRLSTSRGRFAVKAFSRDQHAHGAAASEGPVRLELAAAGRLCAERAGRGWSGRLRAALPLLAEVEALVAARAAEAVPLVVTHSDLVPGNVLVSAGGRAWIVDWDDTGRGTRPRRSPPP